MTTATAACNENSRLLAAYNRALDLCGAAARALEVARPTASTEDYRRVQAYFEQARDNAQAAGDQWDTHRHEHGC